MQTNVALEGVGYVALDGAEVDDSRGNTQQQYDWRRTQESPGPEDFLKGENRRWQPPADLDHFFQRVYRYYCDKGFWCIVTQWVVELLTLGFTISFSAFLMLFVNWSGLLSARCGVQAAEEGHPPCNLAEEALNKNPLQPLTLFRLVALGYLIVFSLYWLYCFVRFFAQLRDTLEIHDFCRISLGVSDHELQTMAWPALVDCMVAFQKSHRLCIVKDLTAHDMVSRIMRKENYLIGMLNKGVLGMQIPTWLPGAGPASGGEVAGPGQRLLLTKTLEWSLQWCILHYMFDRNFLIRRDFSSNPAVLRKRFRAVGLLMIVLSPFLSIFMFIYFFLRNAELFYHQPGTAGSRRWSNLAKWKFREFNELEHLFVQRVNASYQHAVDYTKQFPSPIVSMLAKLVSFVAGAFAAVLLIIALIDESLLEAQVWGRNLLWYAAILATVLAISRSLITEANSVFDPESCMYRVVCHTHYLPKHWRGAANTDAVRAEFDALFQLKALLFLEEMVSIFLTPFLLWFCLPQCVDRVLHFVQEFTIHVEGVGHVCSLSVFDFELHGSSKYGSPCNASKQRRSSQGKMEKSFLGFKSQYPTWEPDSHGKEFLSRLSHLQEQDQSVVGQTVVGHSLPSSCFSGRSGPKSYHGTPYENKLSAENFQRPSGSLGLFPPANLAAMLSTSGGTRSIVLSRTMHGESQNFPNFQPPAGNSYGPFHGRSQHLRSSTVHSCELSEGLETPVNYEQVNHNFWLDKCFMSASANSVASRLSESENEAQNSRGDLTNGGQEGRGFEEHRVLPANDWDIGGGIGKGMGDSVGTEAEFRMAENFVPGLQDQNGCRRSSSCKGTLGQGEFLVPFREAEFSQSETASISMNSLRGGPVGQQDTDDSEEDRERVWVTRRLSQKQMPGLDRSDMPRFDRSDMPGFDRSDVKVVSSQDWRRSSNGSRVHYGSEDDERIHNRRESGGRASPPLLFGDVYRSRGDLEMEEAQWLVQRTGPR